MLHENAKQRLRRAIPETYDVSWHDPILQDTLGETIELQQGRQITWYDEGRGGQYPKIVLSLPTEGVQRGDLGHVFTDAIYKEDHADPDIAYTKYTASPMRGELHVTVAANSGIGDIPKRVVADQLGQQVFHELIYNSEHLTEPGVKADGSPLDYAWPMEISQPGSTGAVQDTSGMLDEQSVQRREIIFRLDYIYFTKEEVPATDAIRWRTGVLHPGEEKEDVDYTDWETTTSGESDGGG